MSMSGLKFLNKKTVIIAMMATLLLAFAGSAFAAKYEAGVFAGGADLWSTVTWYAEDGSVLGYGPNSGDIVLSSDNDGNKLNVDVSVDISSLEFAGYTAGQKALTLAISKDADVQLKMTDGKIGFTENLTITASGDAGAKLVFGGSGTNIDSRSSGSTRDFTISKDVDIAASKDHVVSMGGNGNYHIATQNIGSADYTISGKRLKLDVPVVKTSENNIKGLKLSYIPTLDLASLVADKGELEFTGNITGNVEAEKGLLIALKAEKNAPWNDRLSAALKVGGDLVIKNGAKLIIDTTHLTQIEKRGDKFSGEYIVVSSDKDIQADLNAITVEISGDKGDKKDVAFGDGGTNKKMIVLTIEGDDDDDDENGLQDIIDNLAPDDKPFMEEGFNLIVKAIDGLDGSKNRPYKAYEDEQGYVSYPENAGKVEIYLIFLDASKNVDANPMFNNQPIKRATGSMSDTEDTEVGSSQDTPVVNGGALITIEPLSGTAFEPGDYKVVVKGFGGVVNNGINGFGALANSLIEGEMKVKVTSSSKDISTGSSGCDAGFGAFALLVIGAAAVLRRKG